MANWNLFRGNFAQTGVSADSGPSRGRIAWKTPLGRQWYSPPLVIDGRAYQACPSRLGRKLICIDVETGGVVWEAMGLRGAGEDELPDRIRLSSRIVRAGHSLFVRALNDDGIYEIAAEDGSCRRVIRGNGILDYRTHPAPIFAGGEQHLVFPLGTQAAAGASGSATGDRIWRDMACRRTDTGELLWTYRVGQYFGTPAITDDSICVGTADGYVSVLDLTAPSSTDTAIGTARPRRIRWEEKLPAAVNASPAVEDGRAFFGCEDGWLYCRTVADGAGLWSYAAGDPEPRAFINFSTPAFAEGMVFIGDARGRLHLVAKDTGTGRVLWQADDWIRARPAPIDGGVIVACIDGSVSRVDYRGSVVWRADLGPWHLTCDPVVSGDSVLVVGSDMVLSCLAADTGTLRWAETLVEYPEDWVAFDEFQSSPAVSDSRVFVGSPGHFMTAVDAASGSRLWRYETGGEIPADPICVDGRVYFGQQGGESGYFCARAADGSILWRQELGRVWAAANLHEGRLFIAGAGGTAYCLDPESGSIRWQFQASSDLYAAPPVFEDLVYFGSWDYWLYALHADTGRLAWRFDAETYLDSGAPAVRHGRLYLPTMGPRFYCLDARTGAILWTFAPQKCWTTNASPAVTEDRVVMTVFAEGGHPYEPYDIWTYCLDAFDGRVLWKYHAGGLNGPTVAGGRVYFGSTSRGDHRFYCLDLAGRGDGTTDCLFTVDLDFNVLESCTAIYGDRAYVYAEDGYLYAIE